MTTLIARIDQLLRGQYTQRPALESGTISLPVPALLSAALLLGVVYGLAMGLYGVVDGRQTALLQLAATSVKVPLLFLLTLLVTFPSLYVFSALANSRLDIEDTFRLLVAAIAVNLAVLASLAPITAFFTLSTKSYPFMQTLNVLFFGIAGLVGLAFLARAVAVVFAADGRAESAQRGRRVFLLWMALYGAVGAQMGWILRPFIGAPGVPFELFRERESNFLAGFAEAIYYAFQ
jgi:hypothetical protein